jgi:hypothetical protein
VIKSGGSWLDESGISAEWLLGSSLEGQSSHFVSGYSLV